MTLSQRPLPDTAAAALFSLLPCFLSLDCTSNHLIYSTYVLVDWLVLPTICEGFVSNFLTCMDVWILFHNQRGHLSFLGDFRLSWARSVCPRLSMKNVKGLWQKAVLPLNQHASRPPEGRGQCAAPRTAALKTRFIHLNSSFECLCVQGNLPRSGDSK